MGPRAKVTCGTRRERFHRQGECGEGLNLTWKWLRLLLSVYLGECRKMSRFCLRYQARAGSQGLQEAGRARCSTSEGRLPGGWMNCREWEGASELHGEGRAQTVPVPEPWRAAGGWEGADLHISGCQLAVPNKHDRDDIQGGLVQAPTQDPYQLVGNLGTLTQPWQEGGDPGRGSSNPQTGP